MHDIMFSKEIITAMRAKRGMLAENEKITTVIVSLSPASHLNPAALNNTFSLLTKDTEFADVKLDIKKLGLGIICRVCNNSFAAAEPVFNCPICHSTEIDIAHTKELVIDSIVTLAEINNGG